MTRIAVFSDVHSNLQAFNRFTNILRMEDVQSPFDELVFLGDMLTYGPDPIGVIDKFAELQEEFSIKFLIGNHDQLYFDLQEGCSEYYAGLPDFIKESVDFTLQQLDCSLKTEFNWIQDLTLNDIFFSHANANVFGDWSYVRDTEDATTAALQVFRKGCTAGVFGHVHRLMDERVGVKTNDSSKAEEIRVLNFGSVGQPRGDGSSFGIIESNGNNFSCKACYFEYDKSLLVGKLLNCGFSQITTDRLLGYYR